MLEFEAAAMPEKKYPSARSAIRLADWVTSPSQDKRVLVARDTNFRAVPKPCHAEGGDRAAVDRSMSEIALSKHRCRSSVTIATDRQFGILMRILMTARTTGGHKEGSPDYLTIRCRRDRQESSTVCRPMALIPPVLSDKDEQVYFVK